MQFFTFRNHEMGVFSIIGEGFKKWTSLKSTKGAAHWISNGPLRGVVLMASHKGDEDQLLIDG